MLRLTFMILKFELNYIINEEQFSNHTTNSLFLCLALDVCIHLLIKTRMKLITSKMKQLEILRKVNDAWQLKTNQSMKMLSGIGLLTILVWLLTRLRKNNGTLTFSTSWQKPNEWKGANQTIAAIGNIHTERQTTTSYSVIGRPVSGLCRSVQS